jgi:hypothetical protein
MGEVLLTNPVAGVVIPGPEISWKHYSMRQNHNSLIKERLLYVLHSNKLTLSSRAASFHHHRWKNDPKYSIHAPRHTHTVSLNKLDSRSWPWNFHPGKKQNESYELVFPIRWRGVFFLRLYFFYEEFRWTMFEIWSKSVRLAFDTVRYSAFCLAAAVPRSFPVKNTHSVLYTLLLGNPLCHMWFPVFFRYKL